MGQGQVTPTSSRLDSKVGAWCAGLGLVAVVSVLALWLFCGDPGLRRWLILAALGCVAACIVTVGLRQGAAGGSIGAAELTEAVCADVVGGDEEYVGSADFAVSPPRSIPSRRGIQMRSAAWGIGLASVLIGFVSMAWGTAQRSETIERLHSAGAEFGTARAVKVSDVRRESSRGKDPYTATVVVNLPVADPASDFATATVRTSTNEPLRAGDPVDVLYAPSHPELGAVAGDKSSLGWKVRGMSMPWFERLFFVALWVLCCLAAVHHLWATLGFRSFSRMDGRDRAIRGRYTRQSGTGAGGGADGGAKGAYLEVQTDSGWVHFRADAGPVGLPKSMEGCRLWLYWDARRGERSTRFSAARTPAALVFDNGSVVHGMVSVEQARQLRDRGTSVVDMKSAVPVQEQRSLQLFDVRSRWPFYVDSLTLLTSGAVVICAAFLTFDITGGWRFVAGLVGALGVVAAAGGVRAGDTLSKPSGRAHR